MGAVKTRGIIIKQSDYGEANRILTVFCERYGIIKAVSYGGKKSKNKSAQFMSMGDFELYKGNGSLYTLDFAGVKESFYPIQEDICKLALASYFAQCVYGILGEENPDDEIMRLLLNMLYALAYTDNEISKIKAVFELKLMALGGYEPNMNSCVVCAGAPYAFDTAGGGMVCRECLSDACVRIHGATYKAIQYVLSCSDKRVLSFKLPDKLYDEMNSVSELYIKNQLGTDFKGLEYYKMLTN